MFSEINKEVRGSVDIVNVANCYCVSYEYSPPVKQNSTERGGGGGGGGFVNLRRTQQWLILKGINQIRSTSIYI